MSSFLLLLEIEPEHYLPEQKLWVDVVKLAIHDAMQGEDTARRWIEGNGAKFRFVCSLAGIEPSYLQRLWRQYEEDGKMTKYHYKKAIAKRTLRAGFTKRT